MDSVKPILKVCFFGASVTEQSTGYAAILKKELNADVKIFGFGGMFISDAGICFIDEVLAWHPSICFVDWFSTGYNRCDSKTEELLDTIIYRFTKASCKLIFLFFPYREIDDKEKFYNFCKEFLRKRNIAIIDVARKLGGYNPETILRDAIHTNDCGSRLYANVIKDSYEKIKNKLGFPVEIYNTKYTIIKNITVEKTFTKQLLLEGDCEIIGLYSIKGPYSGILRISDKDNIYNLNTWDRWCYYKRKSFLLGQGIEVKEQIKIDVMNDDFDSSSCKEETNFSEIEKKLVVHKIYFVGKYLRVVNIEEGIQLYTIDNFIQDLRGKNFIVYGAGTFAEYFIQKTIAEKIYPAGIAVTALENNPKELSGILVHTIDHFISYAKNTLVIVAVKNWRQQNEIKDILKNRNFKYEVLEDILL